MYRDIEMRLKSFYANRPHKAVMILGARQIGKTYTITKFANQNYDSVLTIDFVEDESNVELVKDVKSAEELMLRISAKFGAKLIPYKTMIIFDEAQAAPQIISHIKYLLLNYPYDCILTGSLLGSILNDVESVPVGYIDI